MQNIKDQIIYFILSADSLYENDHLTALDLYNLDTQFHAIISQLLVISPPEQITLSSDDIMKLMFASQQIALKRAKQ